MKYKHLSEKYHIFEKEVYNTLKKEIENSKYISNHVNQKAIRVNLFDYNELTVINGNLTFLDAHGYHYSIYSDASLIDLLDILNKLK
jgi:hypothetical protein